jgi:hypothetical protein
MPLLSKTCVTYFIHEEGGCNHAPNSEHDLFMPEAFYEECVEAQQQGRGGA